MSYRDSAVLSIIMGIVGGATGITIALLVRFAVPLEAVFSLLGALIGAGSTVAGAIWVSDRSARAFRSAEISELNAELLPLERASYKAFAEQPGTNMPWPDAFITAINRLEERSEEARRVCDQALQHGKHLTFRVRAKLVHLERSLRSYSKMYHDWNSEEGLHPLDERDMRDFVATVYDAVTAIREEIGSR